MMESVVLRVTRCGWIPLNLRRMVGNALIRKSSRGFALRIDGQVVRGTLDNYIARVVFLTGEFFEYTYIRLLRNVCPPAGCLLDVGANVGNHSLALAGHFQRVYAFEPYPPVFRTETAKPHGGHTEDCLPPNGFG